MLRLPRLFDGLLAAAAIAVGQADIWLGLTDGDAGTVVHHHRGVAALLSLAGMSMLLLRRRAPLLGLIGMFAAAAIQIELVEPVALFFGQFIPIGVMTYAVGAYSPSARTALAGLGVALAGVALVMHSVPGLGSLGDIAVDGGILAVCWGVGWVAGTRGRRAEALALHAERLEREREELIAGERARLARELHDIVAHSVSVIAVQAEAGEALLTDEPERAAEAFRSIQGTSRQALVELRRLLGLLREAGGPPARAPHPGLAEGEELIEQVRRAGLAVALEVDGTPAPLEPGLDLSAYRVVQEALTNALKHAGPARACVRIRYLPTAIEVEVADDGRGTGAAAGAGGLGLVGMRERVALYGGDVVAGADPQGGFAVRARLPLEPA